MTITPTLTNTDTIGAKGVPLPRSVGQVRGRHYVATAVRHSSMVPEGRLLGLAKTQRNRRMPEECWCTLQDVTDHIKVRKETVYDLIQDKATPGRIFGRLCRFRVDAVDDSIRSGQTGDAFSNEKESHA